MEEGVVKDENTGTDSRHERRVVGTLYRDGTGAMSFEYTPEWLSESGFRAISLSLSTWHNRI